MRCDEVIVKSATRMLTLRAAVKAKVISTTSSSVRPPMWDKSDTDETNPEVRWVEALEYHKSEPAPSSQPTRRRNAASAELVDYSMGQAWMSQPLRPRSHWRDRIDISDPPVVAEAPHNPVPSPPAEEPWKKVWDRVRGSNLDRHHRHVAWQVLHNILPCGALTAFRTLMATGRHSNDDAIAAAVATASCPFCVDLPQTISHMLFHCPQAKSVWEYALNIWGAATGHEPPQLSWPLLILDDQRQWSPPRDSVHLWTVIRLVVISGIFGTARQKRKGLPVNAFATASYVTHHLKAAIHRDWHRVQPTDTSHNVLSSLAQGICCSSWLRGRNPAITSDSFKIRWGKTGALCSITGERLEIHLSMHTPVVFVLNL